MEADMNAAFSFLISIGIIAFGIWIVAGTIAAGSPLAWALRGPLNRPPTPLDVMYPVEILQNRQMLERIRLMPEDELRNMLTELLKTETSIEADFGPPRPRLPISRPQRGGFEG